MGERLRVAARVGRRASAPTGGRSGGRLEALQRLAGNRAVTALVQRSAASAIPPLTEGLSSQEEEWLDEVWHDEPTQLLMQAYGEFGEIPTPVIARVGEVMSDGEPSPTTEGVTHNFAAEGEVDIEIGDSTYTIPEMIDDPEGAPREGTPEEEFKMTLVHELFHYVENNTKHIDPERIPTPERLKAILVEPRLDGQPPFTFGWFDAGGFADHLDNVSTERPSPFEGTPVADAKAAGTYEASPDGRGLEEDLATSIGLYASSPATRGHLLKRFPKRYDLVDRYFGALHQKMARR